MKYNIFKKYENASLIFDEIEAKNINEAESECDRILKENYNLYERLEKRNIYFTKLIECKVLRFKGFFINDKK